MNENIDTVHFSPFVPDVVPAENKTEDHAKVTCEACRETMREVSDDIGIDDEEIRVSKETDG